MVRGVKGLVMVGALAGIGVSLRWATADSVASAKTQDLPSMAALTVGAVAWVAYGWLLIAVLATVLEQVPGAVGRTASAVGARITSPTSRALLRSALGVAAVTPLTIGVAHASPGDGGSQPLSGAVEPRSSVQLSESSPNDWRSTEKPSSLRLTEPPSRTTQPIRRPAAQPTASTRTPAGDPTQPPNQPAPVRSQPTQAPERPAQIVVPDRPAQVPERPTQVGVPDRPTEGAPTRYTDLRTGQLVGTASQVVRPGDSLWSLAAAELGPTAGDAAVATRWPQWYAANRAVIGPDPDLILPGQVLRIPSPTTDQPVPPTHQEK
jgi:hypothetical protein